VGEPIRTVLVDDEALVRAGLSLLLEAEPDIVVVGEAEDGCSAIELVKRHQPDVVIMDLRMGPMDGVSATRILTSDAFLDEISNVPSVLVLTTFSEDDAVRDALRAGASGYVLKSSAPRMLGDAVRSLAGGGGWLDSSITRGLLAEFAANSSSRLVNPKQLQRLTSREREVLIAVAHGFSNAEIAQRTFISESTVKTHIHRIFMKLGISDRAQAVTVAFKSGLVKPSDHW
jgi:DNA-binding NarL/FixJ family response regulator